MAYSHTLNLVQGDTNPQLVMTVRDSNTAAEGSTLDPEDSATWAVVDLTGSTVRLKLREAGATTLKDTIVGVILDALNGNVVFLLNDTTLDTAGTLEGEIEVTDATDRVQTVYDLIRVNVRAQF